MGIFQILALVAICLSFTEGLFFNPNPAPGRPMYSFEDFDDLSGPGFSILSLLNQRLSTTPARDPNVGISALGSGAANAFALGLMAGNNPYPRTAQEYYETAPEDRPDAWTSLLNFSKGVPKSVIGGVGTVMSIALDIIKAVNSGKQGADLLVEIGKSLPRRGQEFGANVFEPIAKPELDLTGSIDSRLPFIITHIFALLLQPLAGLLNILGNNLAQNVNDARGSDEFPTPSVYYVNPPYPFPRA